jgi:hypothetical protein
MALKVPSPLAMEKKEEENKWQYPSRLLCVINNYTPEKFVLPFLSSKG